MLDNQPIIAGANFFKSNEITKNILVKKLQPLEKGVVRDSNDAYLINYS